MPRRLEEPSVILGVMVPKSLRLAVRLHCVEVSIQARQFIMQAIEERLVKVNGKPRLLART